jgi:subtilisin family serine protease
LSSSWNFATGSANPYVGDVSHGTSCAGIAAGAFNNSLCGAGIAYRAQISGVVAIGISGVTLSIALTATSMTVNVSSNSWAFRLGLGNYIQVPQSTFDALFTLATRGVVTVFSSGNDALYSGSCSYSEMVSDSHIILVGATNHLAKKSWYSSECSSVFVAAPGGDIEGKTSSSLRISTAENDGRCTTEFVGTSASCPMISGVVALIKQSNRLLKIRDVQHILARTSRRIDPSDASWQRNSAGLWHSNKYGFGLVDAHKALLLSEKWRPLPQPNFSPMLVDSTSALIPDGTGALLNRTLNVTLPLSALVEHVAVVVDSDHPAPNQLLISITSPSGTVSTLTTPFLARPAYRMEGYNNMIACTDSNSPNYFEHRRS